MKFYKQADMSTRLDELNEWVVVDRKDGRLFRLGKELSIESLFAGDFSIFEYSESDYVMMPEKPGANSSEYALAVLDFPYGVSMLRRKNELKHNRYPDGCTVALLLKLGEPVAYCLVDEDEGFKYILIEHTNYGLSRVMVCEDTWRYFHAKSNENLNFIA